MKYILITLTLALISCSDNNPKELNTAKTNLTKGDTLKELITLNENEKLIAKFSTNLGDFDIELFANRVPKTVENFVGLSLKHYYENVTFHRVIDNFMIQGGDPTGTGMGGDSYWGGNFEDEFQPDLIHNTAGILSMANAGPNINGSQFFITLVPTPWLNGKHSVFGKVITGLDVVQKIGKVKTNASDKPIEAVVIKKINIEKIILN